MSDDKSSHTFLNLLKEKAREGVNVYLSVDLLNDLSFERKVKKNYRKVACILHIVENRNYHSGFIPYIIVIIARITTIDGEIGYTGGFNIGDEYLGKDKRFGYWRDYHVRLKEKEQKI